MINDVRAIILAAGKSTRFQTKKTKLTYTICGQPMITYPSKILASLNIPITFVLGHQAEDVKNIILKSNIKNIDFILQKKLLGTGNAVSSTKQTWDKNHILILNGDTPLLAADLIESILQKHKDKNADLTFLTTYMLSPKGYGRVIKENDTIKIVEEKNCTEKEKETNKVNTGIYLVSKKFLEDNIDKIQKNPVSGEFYLTDMVEMASNQNKTVQDVSVPYDFVRGVNTLEELWAAEQIKRSQLMKRFMQNGVRFELAQNIHLDLDVEIGAGSFVATGVHLLKGAKIGENCFIGAFSIIDNTTIGNDSKIYSHCVLHNTKIGTHAKVGPFARLRDNVILKNNVTIGNFVELKNTKIDEHSKAKHLAYLGDSTIGKNVNIGAGTITCNHDGVNKNPTTIEDNVYIGSNNTIIAPLKIEQGAYTAAGSTITKDVPKNTLAIGRSRQINKLDYVKKLNAIKKKEQEINQIKNELKNVQFLGATKTENQQENNL